jgi:TetR/AcrR family transcriptional repressor of mexJK operon
MGRKKQDPENNAKRTLILQIASKMFISQGYSSVSMDALAEAVPVSKRTLYNHFTDKRALFTAVMQQRCQHVFDQLEQTLYSEKTPRQALTALGKQFLTMVLEPDAINIYRTAITEAQAFPELGELFFESGPRRAARTLADYLKKLDAAHALTIPNPELAAHFFFSMIKSRPQMQCMLRIKTNLSKKEKDEIVHYAVDVFLKGHACTA